MVKVLFLGDVQGEVEKTCQTISKMSTEFDLALAAGQFSSENMDIEEGACKCPLHFIDSGTAAQDLVEDSPDGDALGESLRFLGHFGVKRLHGLTVAYLSGSYNEDTYKKTDVLFEEGYYTSLAVDRLLEEIAEEAQIDILLTSEWPEGVEQFSRPRKKRRLDAVAAEAAAAAALKAKKKAPKVITVTPAPGPAPLEAGFSPALKRLLETEPRYWVCSGLKQGSELWKRDPWKHRRRVVVNPLSGEEMRGVTRFIALPPVTEGTNSFHAVDLDPKAVPSKADWDAATAAPGEDPAEVEREEKAKKEAAEEAKQSEPAEERMEWKPSFGTADQEERRRWKKMYGINPEDFSKAQKDLDKAMEPKEKKERRESLYKHQRPDKRKRGVGGNMSFQESERRQAG